MSRSHARVSYESFARLAPAARTALAALDKAVDDAGLDKSLREIIKLRASQINGCAFCVQYHLNVARKLGVPARKLDLVAVWREAGVFSPREMAALDWTEALTGMTLEVTSELAYAQLREHFSEPEAVFLTIAIGTINQWNRIAVALRFDPPIPAQG